MARTRKPYEWEKNQEFCVIACVAWFDDYSNAKGKTKCHGATRKAAAERLQLRYEGFTLTDLIADKVLALQEATTALGTHIATIADTTQRLKQ